MKKIIKGFGKLVLVAVLLSPVFVIGQKKQAFKPTINWNVKGQIWLRHSDLNDGSLVNGESTSSFTDVSLRRLRIPISSQVTPKIFMYSIIGGNNYNIKNKELKVGILDLYVEYEIESKEPFDYKTIEHTITVDFEGWEEIDNSRDEENDGMYTVNFVDINFKDKSVDVEF